MLDLEILLLCCDWRGEAMTHEHSELRQLGKILRVWWRTYCTESGIQMDKHLNYY